MNMSSANVLIACDCVLYFNVLPIPTLEMSDGTACCTRSVWAMVVDAGGAALAAFHKDHKLRLACISKGVLFASMSCGLRVGLLRALVELVSRTRPYPWITMLGSLLQTFRRRGGSWHDQSHSPFSMIGTLIHGATKSAHSAM